MSKLIGISGVARSGKDLFIQLLSEKIDAKRFSFADKLKEELRPVLLSLYGIDIFSCSPQEKELVRKFLVFHGQYKREISNGTYWVDEIDKKVRQFHSSSPQTICAISDVRFPNEVDWLKSLGGTLVHITCYNGSSKILPVNHDELINDPVMQERANYKVIWEMSNGNFEGCRKEVDEFITFYKNEISM